jgi:cellobiose phosphorylase
MLHSGLSLSLRRESLIAIRVIRGFCTQYNNPLTEENIGPILSGTATWLTLSFFEAMGLRKEEDGLTLHPILEKGQGDLTYHYHFADGDYEVILHKKKNHYAFNVTRLTLDGVSYDPEQKLPLAHDHETHRIEATLA